MTSGQKKILKIIFYHRFRYRLLILFLSFLSALFGLALPYYQKNFTADLNTQSLLICLVLSLFYLILNQMTLFIGQNESVQAQRALADTIYLHDLNMKPLTLQNKTVGEVVSLYSTDIPSITVWLEQSLPYGLTTFFPLILTPLFLYYFYQLPLDFSFGLVLVLLLINGAMAYRQSVFFFRFKRLAADRMGLVNEWIQNIRGLKILNWLEGFENKIIKKRREETSNRVSMVTNGQIMNSISSSMNYWLNLAILSFFIWLSDQTVHKTDLIALLWITTVFLTRPLRQLPWFFTFVFDAWTSYKRLAEFLDLKNEDYHIKSATPANSRSLLEIKALNLTVNHIHKLHDINLTIHPGEIVALIGHVGSGKSLLVKSMVLETPFTADVYYKTESSYVPQEYFVMSASLRDNVAFEYNTSKNQDSIIREKLRQAQFDFELDRVTDGLETMIGERGLNLSGGQKQRVSLARQLMNPAPLLILDDPLSAVDTTTEKKLIAEFLKLKEKGHSILLTTQRFTMLKDCDRIFYIEDGTLKYTDSSEKFLNAPQYQSFLKGLV